MMAKQGTRSDARGKARARSDYFHTIYVYYVQAGGIIRFYEWWDPDTAIGDLNDLKGKIGDLADNAFKNGRNPPYYTKLPEHMLMRRKSYVAFVANKTDWNAGTSNDVSINGNTQLGFPTKGTHTFFPKYAGEIPAVGSFPAHHVICFENRLIRGWPFSGPLGNSEQEHYRFTLPFASVMPTILAPDSGGTNMGPPVPPPSRFRSRPRLKSAR